MTKRSYFSCSRAVHILFVLRVHDSRNSQYAPRRADELFGFRIITASAREKGARCARKVSRPALAKAVGMHSSRALTTDVGGRDSDPTKCAEED